uniref:Uncharacterized protein n=1 Tax=Anguilla anguilla TaxID=7936 RepID=A0A0E9VM88_ANGAN
MLDWSDKISLPALIATVILLLRPAQYRNACACPFFLMTMDT